VSAALWGWRPGWVLQLAMMPHAMLAKFTDRHNHLEFAQILNHCNLGAKYLFAWGFLERLFVLAQILASHLKDLCIALAACVCE